jgi:hypothetical protein
MKHSNFRNNRDEEIENKYSPNKKCVPLKQTCVPSMYLKIYFLIRLRGLNAPIFPTPALRALLAWTAETQ